MSGGKGSEGVGGEEEGAGGEEGPRKAVARAGEGGEWASAIEGG